MGFAELRIVLYVLPGMNAQHTSSISIKPMGNKRCLPCMSQLGVLCPQYLGIHLRVRTQAASLAIVVSALGV